MRKHLTILIIALIAITGMAGCASASQIAEAQAASTPQPEIQTLPTVDPKAEIILNMVEQLNAGNVDESLAYFADDALLYFIGMPPTGIEFYGGPEGLRPMWEYCVNDHFKEEIEITKVVGDLVYANGKTWMDFTQQLGVAPNEFIEIYQVKDGKITTYGSTMTEAALSRFKPAFFEAMPPEPTALPSSDPPVSEISVTIAGGTCTTDNPNALQAGEVNVKLNVEDEDKSLYALYLFTLDPDKDIVDLMASTAYSSPPSWADVLLEKELGPGKSETYTVMLEKGPVYLICFSQPPALPIGNAGPFEVLPAPELPPASVRGESDVMVTFTDKGCSYDGPPVLPSGKVNVIMNMQGLDIHKVDNALMFFTLEKGYDLEDLVDAIWMPSPPDWSDMIFFHVASAGEVTHNELTIEAGPLYYLCLSGSSEQSSELVGEGGPLEVGP